MSYILEAIKKAEQERGGSLLPNKPVSANQPQEDASKSIPWVAIAIFLNAAILCAWIVFQYINKSDSHEQIVTDEMDKSIPAEMAVTNLEKIETADETAVANTEEIATEVIDENTHPEFLQADDNNSEQIAEPVQPKISETNEQEVVTSEVPSFFAPTDETNENIVEEDINVEPTTEEPEISVTSREIEQINEPIALIESLPAIEEAVEPELIAEPYIEDEPIEEEPSEPVVVAIVENPNVPELGELPFSMQQQIPKIQISVHIYNVEKDARKVRINGGLFLEGQSVETDLIIEEITAHGVIFDYQGTLFKLSLR